MSSWQLQVSKTGGKKTDITKGLPRLTSLCGELCRDIRRDLSWWEIMEDDPTWPGRRLILSLAKKNHRAWTDVWHKAPLNEHRKTLFGWNHMSLTQQQAKQMRSAEEYLDIVPPGAPPELEKELCTALLPENLCTGFDTWEDDATITLLVHLDTDTLELASARVPLEELFSTDVGANFMEVSLRGDGYGLVWGELNGSVVPEMTTWQYHRSYNRYGYDSHRKAPREFGLKCSAFFNPALAITLTKAESANWGEQVFKKAEGPKPAKPKEQAQYLDRVKRSLVLSPAAPMDPKTKQERAEKLCADIEHAQDNTLHKVVLTFHLESRLENDAGKFKVDLGDYFSLKVTETTLELDCVADNPYPVVMGRLGGEVVPDKTIWEHAKEGDHLVIKVIMTKAKNSQTPWSDVFVKCKPWEFVALDHAQRTGGALTDGQGE